MSGLFRGSQMNWACLTKEAYAIYMSIKKLAYYLEDTDITLRSDHLALKKFLVKNTLNSKVNNWAIEILPFHITFEYIKGIKNTLANTMSRLINIDPQIHYLLWKFLVLKQLKMHQILMGEMPKKFSLTYPTINYNYKMHSVLIFWHK